MQRLNRKTKRGEIEEEEEEQEEEEGQQCTALCQCATKIECVCRCGGVNHAIKSLMRMDKFFEDTEEKAVVPTATAVAAMVRCDDCNRSVPAEEVKVWLAPVAVEAYEGEQDPVYMCRKCTKTFLDDTKEYHFEDLLSSVEDAVRKYNQPILEKWK